MSVVVDYAFKPWPSTAALKAAGASGVSRYLSYVNPRTAPKIVTKAEYDALLAAGLAVVLNWEYDTHDFTNAGFDARLAANEALRQARALGYPDVCPIYFSVDFDATASQWSTIAARFRAVNAVLGVARTGIYGPWDVLEWARRDGVAAWFWQAGMSTSWSAGRNRNLWPGAHLRQRRTATIGGADCDINDIIQADYGQLGGDDVGINELAYNADSNAWAVRMGVDSQVYPGDNPGPLAHAGNPLWDLLRRLDTNVAADLAEDKATTAALKALVDQVNAAGGSVDAAPILAAIAAARDEESAAVAALHDQVADLTRRLAAAEQAAAAALTQA
jgi:hypothetical protein